MPALYNNHNTHNNISLQDKFFKMIKSALRLPKILQNRVRIFASVSIMRGQSPVLPDGIGDEEQETARSFPHNG